MFAKQPVRPGAAFSKGRARAASLLVVFILSLTSCTTGLGSRHRALVRELDGSTSAPLPTLQPFSPPLSAPIVDLQLGGASLSRPAFVRAVLEQNPTVRSAEFTFRAALAHYPQRVALDDPMLSYGISPRSIRSKTIDDGHKLELRQHFPFPGKLRLRGEEALAHAEAAKYDLAAVRLELAATASLLFDDYYYLGRAIEINDEHTELVESFKAITTRRYEVGNGSQQDPLHAETELAHLVHQSVVLKTKLEIVSMRMNTLLRRAPSHPIPPPPATLVAPAVPDPAADPERIALENRPELRAAVSHVEAEEASVAQARREFFPDFTLVAAYNTLLQQEENQLFTGFSINLPLQLDRRRAALREAEAKRRRARSEQDRAADEIRLEAAVSQARLHEAEHVLMLFRDTLLPPALDRIEAARAGFETGRNSFLTLIEANRHLRVTADGLEKARAERSKARTEFLRALGLFAAPSMEVSTR